MAYLKCDVRNCSYNKERYCTLTAIRVGRFEATNCIETCCESFAEDEYTASNCAKEEQEQVDIECHAVECVFNNNRVCHAIEVEVGGVATICDTEDTQCNTFICGENRI